MVTRSRLKKSGGRKKVSRLERAFKVKIQSASGTTEIRKFKSKQELKDNISFDGQGFWLGGQLLGEIETELQWNWEKLTDKVIDGEKESFANYVIETMVI